MTRLQILVGEVKFPWRETPTYVQFLKKYSFETYIFFKMVCFTIDYKEMTKASDHSYKKIEAQE